MTSTEREEAVRQLQRHGLSDGAIAERLRITGRSVFRIRQRLGLAAVA